MNGYCKMEASTGIATESGATDSSPEPEDGRGTRFAVERQAGAEEEGGGREQRRRKGVVLGRTCSSASLRCGECSGGATSLHSKVWRAFSMRKPASAAGAYWRIHDNIIDGEFADNEQQQEMKSPERKKNKKKAKILAACRKIFGF